MERSHHAPASAPQKPADTHSYKGWLNSDYFWKRALAVIGYSIVGQGIIFLVLCIPFLLISLFVGSTAP